MYVPLSLHLLLPPTQTVVAVLNPLRTPLTPLRSLGQVVHHIRAHGEKSVSE